MGLVYPASGAGYLTTLPTGSNNLKDEIRWIVQHCPTSSKIVLIGHSQGAHVIGNAIQGLNVADYPRIKAVVLLGDPTYLHSRAINSATSSTTGHGIFNRYAQERNWLDSFGTTGINGGKQRIRSYCYTGDAICTSSGDMTVHSSYLNSEARRTGTINWINSLP